MLVVVISRLARASRILSFSIGGTVFQHWSASPLAYDCLPLLTKPSRANQSAIVAKAPKAFRRSETPMVAPTGTSRTSQTALPGRADPSIHSCINNRPRRRDGPKGERVAPCVPRRASVRNIRQVSKTVGRNHHWPSERGTRSHEAPVDESSTSVYLASQRQLLELSKASI